MDFVSTIFLITSLTISAGVSAQKFADPLQPPVFKKLFSSDFNVTRQFINDVLYTKGRNILYKGDDNAIVNITLYHPKWVDAKNGALFTDRRIGFKCMTNDYKDVLVELQIWDEIPDEDVSYRLILFMNLLHASYAQEIDVLGERKHLKGPRREFKKARKSFGGVWVIGVCNFVARPGSERYVTTGAFRNESDFDDALRGMAYAIVEPKKMTSNVKNVETNLDRWLFFLNNAPKMNEEERDLLAKDNPAILQAFNITESAA